MAAPTLVQTSGNTWTTHGSHAHDGLVYVVGRRCLPRDWDHGRQHEDVGTPTGGPGGFGAVTGFPTNTGSNCKIYAWTATAGSGGSGTISASATGGTMANIQAYQYSGSTGLGNATTPAVGTSTKTISLTRAGANSAVVWFAGDWAALSTSGRATSPVGGTVDQATSDAGAGAGSQATMYAFHWDDQGGAGTTSYGVSGISGTNKFTMGAIEIKGTAAAASLPSPVIIRQAVIRARIGRRGTVALYKIFNGPAPTTASQVAVTTSTAIKTLLQVKPGPHRR
jgi:hypothetical protein